MNKKMRINCPFCGHQYIIEEVPNGTQAECGKCEKVFTINEGDMTPIVVASKWKMQAKPILKKAALAVAAIVILSVGYFLIKSVLF